MWLERKKIKIQSKQSDLNQINPFFIFILFYFILFFFFCIFYLFIFILFKKKRKKKSKNLPTLAGFRYFASNHWHCIALTIGIASF